MRGNQLDIDDVSNQTKFLLTNFVQDKMDEDQIPVDENVEELQEPCTPNRPPIEHSLVVQIGKTLKEIGDTLEKDENFQNLFAQIPERAKCEAFQQVAGEVFNDGVINWGRIVALFYFAYRMILKHIPSIRTIINFVVDYIRDNLAIWIIGRGGWKAIGEYFGTPTKQAAIVLGAGIILSAAIYFKKPKV